MTHEELEDTVPLYAVGALERVERQSLEAHLLSGCMSCHTALKEYQSVAVVLPFGLTIMAPPHTLKAKILAAGTPIASAELPQDMATPSLTPGDWMNHFFPPEATPRTASFDWVLGIAILAVLALGGYATWNSSKKLSHNTAQLTQLQAEADRVKSELATTQQQLDERAQSLVNVQEALERRGDEVADMKDQLIQREAELESLRAQVTQRGARVPSSPEHEFAALLRLPFPRAAALFGTEQAKQATGMLHYDERTQRVWLYALNLPESPIGMSYQLWALRDKPVSIGTFRIGSGISAYLLVKPFLNFADVKQFTVTLEPRGGRPEPTGPLFLASHL